MSPAVTNRIDAAASVLSDRTRGLLCMLGQDAERGYRRALAPIEHRHRGGGFTLAAEWPVERAVRVLDLVTFGADRWTGPKVSDDALADLLSFVIQRMAHADAGTMQGAV